MRKDTYKKILTLEKEADKQFKLLKRLLVEAGGEFLKLETFKNQKQPVFRIFNNLFTIVVNIEKNIKPETPNLKVGIFMLGNPKEGIGSGIKKIFYGHMEKNKKTFELIKKNIMKEVKLRKGMIYNITPYIYDEEEIIEALKKLSELEQDFFVK